jgi:uncharacterized membrane protein
MRQLSLIIMGVIMWGFAALPASADLKLCNDTNSNIGVALGYGDVKGNTKNWRSEGWWNLGPKACDTLLEGVLIARYYYVHAVDYDRGGFWGGKAELCTRDKLFTIQGIKSCIERGFRKTGFFEVDTGEEQTWTITLTDAQKEQSKKP